MRITIEIDTDDNRLGFDLFESRQLGEGTTIDIAEGITVDCQSLYVRKAGDAFDTLTIVVNLATGIAAGTTAGVLAAWLTSKLQGRTRRFRIERTVVELREGEVKRVLTEKIEHDA